jgi:hypothetical protein
VGVLAGGVLRHAHDEVGVGLERTDGGVHLSERDSDLRHVPSLASR